MSSLFASRSLARDLSSTDGHRHGTPWTDDDMVLLDSLYKKGECLATMVRLLARSSGGVLPKLVQLRHVTYDSTSGAYHRRSPIDIPTPSNEETQMSQTTIAVIESVTLIQGQPAVNKSDDDIFGLIAKLEQQKASLSNIKNQPKKLLAKIEAIDSDIAALVEYVDGRD